MARCRVMHRLKLRGGKLRVRVRYRLRFRVRPRVRLRVRLREEVHG